MTLSYISLFNFIRVEGFKAMAYAALGAPFSNASSPKPAPGFSLATYDPTVSVPFLT